MFETRMKRMNLARIRNIDRCVNAYVFFSSSCHKRNEKRQTNNIYRQKLRLKTTKIHFTEIEYNNEKKKKKKKNATGARATMRETLENSKIYSTAHSRMY